MKKTIFADPLYFASGEREYASDLEVGVDTTKTGYNAFIRYSAIATVTSGTGASAKVRVYRVPFNSSVFVPFGLLEASIIALLTSFFQGLDVLQPTGTVLSSNQGDAEPIGAIVSALADIINLVDLPEEDGETPQIDEDVTENE
jgi:hypothetical protein